MAFPDRSSSNSGGEPFDPSKIPPIVRDTALTGMQAHDSPIVNTDTVLGGIGKAQGQIDAIKQSKGANNGIAELDETGKVKSSQLPAGLYRYQARYDPSTNTPPLADGTEGLTGGEFYICSADGTHDFGSGAIELHIDDVIMYEGATSKWSKHNHHVESIESVNGKTDKAVILDGTDIKVSPSDQRTIADAIQANHSDISSTTTLSADGEEAHLDFAGIRWGYKRQNNKSGVQFYRAVTEPMTIDFAQKSYYGNLMEGRNTGVVNLDLSNHVYDTLNWAGNGFEWTVAFFEKGDELWQAEMIIFGTNIQTAHIWAKRVS